MLSTTRGRHRVGGALAVTVIGAVAMSLALTGCGQATGSAPAKGTAPSISAQSSEASVEMFRNELEFSNFLGCKISSMTFALRDSTVTAGQPWAGVRTSVASTENDLKLLVNAYAGRQESTDPAVWFAKNAPVFIGPSTAIEGLNFAFIGELTLDSDSYLIAIGQPNDPGGANRWYVGGQGFTIVPGNSSHAIVTPDGKYSIAVYSKDPSVISVTSEASPCKNNGAW